MAASSDSNATSPYPIREVWDAITNPARLADWWLPFDADITVDLREGGEMVFAGRGDEPVTMTCTILRVEPPMLLEHTHADAGSYMRWELEPVDTGCVLRLSHFVHRPRRRDRQLLRRRTAHLARPARTVPRRPSGRVGLGRLRRGAGALRRPRPRTAGRRAVTTTEGSSRHRERITTCLSCSECRTSACRRTGSAPVKARASNGPSGTPTRPTWPRGPAPPRAGRTAPIPADPAGWTTTSPATSRTTSAPRSWVATSSDPSVARGRTSTGRAGGATPRRSTRRCSSSPTTTDPASRWPTPRSTSSTPHPRRRCSRPRTPLTARTCGSGAASPPFGEFLDADLVDTMHVAVAPVELGRGERLWTSPDDLLDRFHLETVPSPSGVTHLLFWRR